MRSEIHSPAAIRHPVFALLAASTVLFGTIRPASAQWLTQTLVIKPGWTAVYLNVDASGYGENIDQLVGNDPANPIVEIWMWRAAVSPAQYVSNPLNLLSDGNYWLKWARNPSVTANELEALVGNSAYLIHSSATNNYTWRVQGRPVPPSYLWDITGLNLIGFSTPSVNPPNFQNYLAPAGTLAGILELYTYTSGPLVQDVNPISVFSDYTKLVTRGQAFWMRDTNVNNTYFGPFTVKLPNPSGIAYGASGGQVTLHLYNATTNSLTVSARLLASETPPAGQTSIVGPPPLLLQGALNASNLTYAFTALGTGNSGGTTNSLSWTLPPSGQPGSDVGVVLGVNRYAMTASSGSLYAGILQFTDSLGLSEIDVPVSAQSASTAGLWVGSASVSQVGSYLKTYATNTDGSITMNTVTNFVSTTNNAILMATNVLISNYITNRQAISNYEITNLVVNTYTTNQLSVATNSDVAVTNVAIQTFASTNVVISTTVTNFTYDAQGDVVWLTQTTTNVSGSAYSITNPVVSINQIAMLDTNGSPVVVTNLVTDFVIITNLLTTNGVFMDPVTSQGLSSLSLTNYVITTNLTFNVLTTNRLALSSASSNVTVNIYSITNIATACVRSTNYVTASAPLAVITNPPNWIVVSLLVNNYAVTNQFNQFFFTNYNVISNNFVLNSGATNPVGSTTNQLLAYEAGASSGTATNYASTNLNIALLSMYRVNNTPVLVTNAGSYMVASLNTNLGAVVTPYPLRLIVHNDGTTCRLLERVYYGLQQDTNLVIATTESVLDTSHLNIARRISATQLPWSAANTPWIFSGSLILGGVLQTTVTDSYDDQTSNPFLHTYHPDHNNLDPTFKTELLRGAQSYDITRQITLTVSPPGTDFESLITANTSLSGTYAETIILSGFNNNQRTFNTVGTFSLTRISDIAALTTQ